MIKYFFTICLFGFTQVFSQIDFNSKYALSNAVSNNLFSLDTTIQNGKFGEIHSILIWHDGKMIFEKYYNSWPSDSVHQLQSATKSVIATLMGIAIQKGYINSVNDAISKYLPETPIDKNNITIKDLLTQRHGLKWRESIWEDTTSSWRILIDKSNNWTESILSLPMDTMPGTKFNYSNAAPSLISFIIQRASKMSIDSFAIEYLFKPLNISKYWFLQRAGGPSKNGMALLSLTSKDMLKIGILYLQKGKWNNVQILPENYVNAATSSIVKDVGMNGVFYHYDYGYLWWSNPIYRLNRDSSETNAYMARGAGGQNIIVDKSNKLVMVITAWNMARSNWPQAIYHDFVENLNWETKWTLKDFKNFKFFEGKWEGSDDKGGEKFYEEYIFSSDSLVTMKLFDKDKTFAKSTDTASIYYFQGNIYHKSGNSIWEIENMNETECSFMRNEKSYNRFVWKKLNPVEWEALLYMQSTDKLPSLRYFMKKIN